MTFQAHVHLNALHTKDAMNVFFITGTSGSGKSTLVALLKSRLPQSDFVVYDFDENGVPDNADAIWRQKTTDAWLVKAHANSKQQKTTIICGVSVPSEVLHSPEKADLKIYFGFIKIPDALIIQRLKERKWPEQLIEDNVNWAHYLEAEVKRQSNHKIVENASVGPEKMADAFIEWIFALLRKNH
jgi:broad-specificity NMP kinase